jgi:chromosome segregation ATPase
MKKLADENEELTWSRDSLKVQLNTQTQARERLKAELAKEKEKNSDKKVLDLEAQIKILVESNAEVKCDLVKTKAENEKMKSDICLSKEMISAKERQRELACQHAKSLDEELKVRIRTQAELESSLSQANRKIERLISETKALKTERVRQNRKYGIQHW